MPVISTQVQIAQLTERYIFLQREIEENKAEAEANLKRVTEKAEADARTNAAAIAALEAERTKALKWGVMTLGSAVMGMAYWIFDKLIRGEIR